MRSRRRLVQLVIASVSACPALSLAQTVYSGANNGDWNTTTNWSAGTPVAGVDARINNNASNVIVNLAAGQTGAAKTLTIDSGDTLQLGNNSALNLDGSLAVAGSLKFLPVGNDTYLRFSSPTATISGAGVIDLNYGGSSGQARIEGPASGTITSTGTIRGSGYLYETRFTNAIGGVLENYQTTGQLYLDANGGASGLFINRGTIRALASSMVTFTGDFGGTFDSANGLIQANGSGAVVRFLNNASVAGGLYSTSGGGEIVVEAGHAGNASNFANAGTFRVRNNGTFRVSGAINNTGEIIVDAGANDSTLNIAANTTISGLGTTRLLGTVGGGSGVVSGTGTLTIDTNHTVRGEGYFYEMNVVNNGTIIGDSSTTPRGGTYLDPNSAGPGLFVNNGTIQVTANNYLTLTGDFGGDFKGNGTYRADGANAFMHLANSVTVNGGNWTTTLGGEIRVPEGHTARMNSPTITTGSTVAVLNNGRLYVNGTVTNAGTLEVRPAANDSYLTIESDTAFAGTGSTILTSSASTRAAVTGSGRLTIPANYTVSGNGYFYEMKVQNNGLILADRTTRDMYLDPNSGAADLFVNDGTIKAAAGATVTLTGDFGGNFSGTGTYRADGAGAFVNLISGVAISGGTVTTTAGGVVQIAPNHTATLTNTTVSAGSTLSVANNARLNLNGTPVLNGTIAVNAGMNSSFVTINGTTNLNTGTLTLNGNPGTSSAQVDGNGTLNIGPAFTVSGNGSFYEMQVNNAGTILADRTTGAMTLDSRSDAADRFKNTGTIGASTGATLILTGDYGGNFAGAGTYRADGTNAALNMINSASVVGGTFTTTLGGKVGIPANHTGYLTGSAISSGSTFTVANNSTLVPAGTITNAGTIAITSAANDSNLNVTSNTLFDGAGTVRLTSTPGTTNARVSASAVLTIGPNQTVAGNGFFYESKVVNNGTIVADQPTGSMYLDSNSAAVGQFTNNGTLRANNGATLTLSGDYGGTFVGSGAVIADGTITTVNSLGGNMTTDVTGAGTFRAESSSNVGFRSFKVANLAAASSGVARVTAGGGSAGTSKVKSVSVTTSGRIDLTDHGMVVDYTGSSAATTVRNYLVSARNGGQWNATGIGSSLANGNIYGVGYGEASALTGTPSTFLGQSIDNTAIVIRYTLNADATLDGRVNFDDLVPLAQNYNLTNKVWQQGDFTYDGIVNFDDLVPLAQNYNASLPGSVLSPTVLAELGGASFAADWALAQSLVPEPTTLMAVAGLLTMAGCRRRSSHR